MVLVGSVASVGSVGSVVPVVLGFPPLILYFAHETRVKSRLRLRGGLPTRDIFEKLKLINQNILV